MEKINIKTFCSLMFDGGKYTAGTVELVKGGKVYNFERDPFPENDGSGLICEKLADYYLYENDGVKDIEDGITLKYNTAVDYLRENGFIDDGLLTVKSIDGSATVEEFKRAADFEHITMPELLQKYADCDEFSLTGLYDGGFRLNSHLDREPADAAYKKLHDDLYATCRTQYDRLTEEEKGALLDFDFLFNDIKEEVDALYRKKRKRPLFPCDMYAENKMKYKQGNSALWHIYHTAGFLQEVKEDLSARVASTVVYPDLALLDDCDSLYLPLKPYVNRTEATYTWHCTTQNVLAKVFYFKLNDTTKNWLLQFKDDYALSYLDDLAFYKGGKLQFSSCTHEGFHTDLSDK
ncbi:MAG: hypothetical protein LUF82_05390 [Clostridia bacterium]|nr:hypothetical protein [Clostridia bacterium]